MAFLDSPALEPDELPGMTYSDSGLTNYTDSPEFQNPETEYSRSRVVAASALTEKTTQLFSGFKTPTNINSSRWRDYGFDSGLERKGHIFVEKGVYDTFDRYHDPYPNWAGDDVPISRENMESIFILLTEIFGFQLDNTKNMFDYLLRLLDSRASRMTPVAALRSLHADYISGQSSNFKKWYFAAKMYLDDLGDSPNCTVEEAERAWKTKMRNLAHEECVVQLGLYLLCWGEANNVRFMPECLCFIFKCCNDYYYSRDFVQQPEAPPQGFLNHVITPIYDYYFDQNFETVEGRPVRRGKDHASVIGYDDINQLFWYEKGLQRIVLEDGKTKFMSVERGDRFLHFGDVLWKKAFYKTYRESRTWSHILVNFNRIWIIHCCVFWYYITFNSPTLYTRNYQIQRDTKPTTQATLSAMALSGAVASLINIFATLNEYAFVPRKWPGAESLLKRLLMLLLIFIANVTPSVIVLILMPIDQASSYGLGISAAQFVLSLCTVLYFSFQPLGLLFGSYLEASDKFAPSKVFTSSVHQLTGKALISLYGLWGAVFFAKFIESYFFLVLSIRDPVRELMVMTVSNCTPEAIFGSFLCELQPRFLLGIMFLTDLLLFFLDTYLWYIIWNTVFSVCRSFYMGVSIWTPWRNIFSRLPKRVFSKIVCSRDKNTHPKLVVLQVWNSVVISMYREHIISLEHVQKLIYHQVDSSGVDDTDALKEPIFFVSQEDSSIKNNFFESHTEAQRRITFFAQSLSTTMPEPCAVDEMPTFTVLIPHYNEKIVLSLKEIIREEDEYSHITLLEYLKQLHPLEWACFVNDTKMLAEEAESEQNSFNEEEQKFNDLPFYCVGYKTATPEYVLRTRIWASLRSQTLYRTVSGFMNYSRAIKLLYDIENPDEADTNSPFDSKKLEQAAVMALRKFRIVVSMQRLVNFTEDERENKDFLLRAYPELQIAYLDKDLDGTTGEVQYFASLIDGSCEINEDGVRVPKYRVRLSGNPILGDGKSDNQNTSLIFCRGEYIQLVDANQDNYLEECLKIRNVLAEFEEGVNLGGDIPHEYSASSINPVAIVGTREYIFSENIGILGDVAAGKEQTFGTLFARTLAQIGGKLHYGHPDFLNGVFMTTRGGVSKAQKGLHLNEDIYAGINTLLKGGRIKHCEYMQCGKGRDLGFGSILNFTTKIGAGMGEQMLSREYFYLGTQLPLDRFLSFYYGHPGFHLNNVFIILSVKLLLLVAVNLSALVHNNELCEYDPHRPFTDPRIPVGCYNLVPVINWLRRCVLSIFVVFGISFVPLCVQELMERGIWKALTRLSKHFASLSPLFEIFVCKIYAQSLIDDLAVGGARYIATGRGFATRRVSFSAIYSRFASESLYFGAQVAMLIVYCSCTMYNISIMWFWVTIVGLCLSPFIYNPNQFYWCDFFLDYKHYIRWLCSGNSKSANSSWITFTRELRSRITGSKKKAYAKDGDSVSLSFQKPSTINILMSQVLTDILLTACVLVAYLFVSTHHNSHGSNVSNAFMRVVITSFGPIAVNMVLCLLAFVLSAVLGLFFSMCCTKFGSTVAFFTHLLAFINHAVFFELFWFLQGWDVPSTILGFTVCVMIQGLVFRLLQTVFLSREIPSNTSNSAWWTGTWIRSGLRWRILTQPLREYLCKVMELSLFVGDFVLGHILLFVQFPILLIPGINKWHSLMLFWLKPSKQIRPQILTTKQKRKQKMVVMMYVVVFSLVMAIFSMVIAVPIVLRDLLQIDLYEYASDWIKELMN